MLVVFRDRGSRLALLGAFVASIAVSVTKLTFAYAAPLVVAFYGVAAMSVVLAYQFFVQSRAELSVRAGHLAGLGVISGTGIALHTIGLSLLPAVYFISIKRLSMVLNVLLGGAIFKEENVRVRLIGASLMLAGVVLIAVG